MTGSISIPQSLQVTESWLAYYMPRPKLCSPESGLPFLWWFFPLWCIRVDYVALLPFFFSFPLGLLVSWPQDSPFSPPTSFHMVLLTFIFTLNSPLAILPYIYNKPPPPPFPRAGLSLLFFFFHSWSTIAFRTLLLHTKYFDDHTFVYNFCVTYHDIWGMYPLKWSFLSNMNVPFPILICKFNTE